MSKVVIKANPDFNRGIEEGVSTLFVAEMFGDTIQGEGINTGVPATFIRLQGCTLNCSWCFGVKKGRRIPRITTLHGENKKINEVKENDILLTFDEKTKKLIETTAISIISREVTEWREIRTEGNLYFVTPEHPFFTTERGLKRADELIPGDEIYHSSSKQKLSYRALKLNPMYNKEYQQKRIKNTDWKTLGEKISLSIKEKQKEGSFIAPILSIKERDIERYKEICEKISERTKKEKNPNWKGGSTTPNYDFLKKQLLDKESVCEKCGAVKKLEVHHLDENPVNDSLENMVCVCHKCHSIIHKRGYNFWNGDRRDKKSAPAADGVLNGIKILSNKKIDITKDRYFGKPYGPKPLKVYNLTCSPYNTYLVDEMWVHNCDSESVWRYGNPYSINEVCSLLETSGLVDKMRDGQHLVLTGGSPLKQQFDLVELIKLFISRFGFKPYIEIENESVLRPLPELINFIDCWNNSPKLESSGNTKRAQYKPELLKQLSNLDNSWFKFVITDEEDWMEIERDFIKPNLIRREQIILMPEGATRNELNRTRELTVNIAIRERVRYSDRLHIVLWDKKTGV